MSYLPTLQATTTAVAPTVGPGAVVQTLQGALIYDQHQGRVTANPNPGLQRSGVSGRVFVDDNANGKQDPGNSASPGVRVVVGSFSTQTDSLGRYHVWDIPAFEPVQVRIDSTSLENPLYVPAFSTASLQPPPNAYRQFDLPLVTGAVLEGRVLRDGTPVPGLTLVLTNLVERQGDVDSRPSRTAASMCWGSSRGSTRSRWIRATSRRGASPAARSTSRRSRTGRTS